VRRPSTTWVGLGVAVIAAMALGRVITERVPVDETVVDPFVRSGTVGEQVELRYADVEVTRVRAAPRLYGVDPIAAAGRFLLVDLELSAARESTTMLGFYLLDAEGRRYSPTNRGSSCSMNTTVPTGLRWYAMFCFDVPREALEGVRMVVAKGDYGVRASGLRRDDLAEIDLGVDADRARELWGADVAYEAAMPGLEPLDSDPVTESPEAAEDAP